MIEIALAGAPMGKERVRVTRDGHAYTPERTLTYEARLAHAAQLAMGERPLLDGPLAVVIEVHVAIPESKPAKWKALARSGAVRPTKKPDADNYAKMLDAFNLIVWQDDSQIVDLQVRKFFSDKPRFVARVATWHGNEVFG